MEQHITLKNYPINYNAVEFMHNQFAIFILGTFPVQNSHPTVFLYRHIIICILYEKKTKSLKNRTS